MKLPRVMEGPDLPPGRCRRFKVDHFGRVGGRRKFPWRTADIEYLAFIVEHRRPPMQSTRKLASRAECGEDRLAPCTGACEVQKACLLARTRLENLASRGWV